MTPTHPENFGERSPLPIDDEYVNEILNDEFGIPDGLVDVTPKVNIARTIHDLVLSLDLESEQSEEKFADFMTGVLELQLDESGNYDSGLSLTVIIRLGRIIEALLSYCREMYCEEEDEEGTGIEEFDDDLRDIFESAVEKIESRKVDEYWDRSRSRAFEGDSPTGDDDEETLRTFRFRFTHDVECESVDLALIDLAGTISTMLEPNSEAPAWTLEEFDDVVMFDEERDPVSRRTIRLAANSARLKGFLGLMEQTEFRFE